MRIWQLEGDEISRQHFLYRALAVEFGCLPAWRASCAASALLKPCHALQQTQEALVQQRESEQREKLMSFITLSNVMEFSNNELGFTEEEWSELSIRMAELQGMLPLYVIRCIQLTHAAVSLVHKIPDLNLAGASQPEGNNVGGQSLAEICPFGRLKNSDGVITDRTAVDYCIREYSSAT
jgi:hypothetical protein